MNQALDYPGVDPMRCVILNDQITLELSPECAQLTNELTNETIALSRNEAQTVAAEILRKYPMKTLLILIAILTGGCSGPAFTPEDAPPPPVGTSSDATALPSTGGASAIVASTGGSMTTGGSLSTGGRLGTGGSGTGGSSCTSQYGMNQPNGVLCDLQNYGRCSTLECASEICASCASGYCCNYQGALGKCCDPSVGIP